MIKIFLLLSHLLFLPRHVQPVLITSVKQSSPLSNSFHTTKYSSPRSWPQRRLAWGQLGTSGTHTLKLHRVRKTQMRVWIKTIETDRIWVWLWKMHIRKQQDNRCWKTCKIYLLWHVSVAVCYHIHRDMFFKCVLLNY